MPIRVTNIETTILVKFSKISIDIGTLLIFVSKHRCVALSLAWSVHQSVKLCTWQSNIVTHNVNIFGVYKRCLSLSIKRFLYLLAVLQYKKIKKEKIKEPIPSKKCQLMAYLVHGFLTVLNSAGLSQYILLVYDVQSGRTQDIL